MKNPNGPSIEDKEEWHQIQEESQVIRIQGKLTCEQHDLLLAATKWIERITNRVPELPVLFMDNITADEMWALSAKLRSWLKEYES